MASGPVWQTTSRGKETFAIADSLFKEVCRLQALYHITLKPTITAAITGAILASQFGEPDHRTAAPRADEDAALPVADPVSVPGPVPVAVELGLTPEETL